ncbi:MAG: 1-(5-phosphoribosyl)-5-[(5-phosphoribosylamino)methylideneamino]imidazole-4-carboxamide isomerase [Anaerolineaceae bacterium]|nr:1-(5-phosphoribosyl)-5-[(5-phosphoribosylamino)methylideneamino]imidazole-4-carboxamide isomerase [Anaerolineaceae bacterium]
MFIIYPAIDLRGGKVVRLKEGDPKRQTIFSTDPVETARQWIEQGAQWIHMVNLDGAFASANDNRSILEKVAQLGIPVQFGGGMRAISDIEDAFNRGAARVVLGTVAIQQPKVVTQAIAKWGAEAICVGLDARDGKITTHGWTQIEQTTPAELGKTMADAGVRHALFTDVNRDGGLGGSNVEATIALGQSTGLQVIASGGVSTTTEIEQLASSGAVAGAVIGMALYEGKIKLDQALEAANQYAN